MTNTTRRIHKESVETLNKHTKKSILELYKYLWSDVIIFMNDYDNKTYMKSMNTRRKLISKNRSVRGKIQ